MISLRARSVSIMEEESMLGDDMYSSTPRSGKWTDKEEIFANKLIKQFQEGNLTDCVEGSTLRAYLSTRLNCAPMRISKKFSGLCIGKLTYTKKHKGDSSGITTVNSFSSPTTTVESAFPTDLDSHGDLSSSFSFDTFSEFQGIDLEDFLPKTQVPYITMSSNSNFHPYKKSCTTTTGTNTSLKRQFEDTFLSSASYSGTERTVEDQEIPTTGFYPEAKRLTPTCCACGRSFVAVTPVSPSPTGPYFRSNSDRSTPVSAYLSPYMCGAEPSSTEYPTDRERSSPVATYYSGAAQPWSTQTYSTTTLPPTDVDRTEAEDWLDVLESLCVHTTATLPAQSLQYTTTTAAREMNHETYFGTHIPA